MKVFYGSPLTVFGQRLGLPISWPLITRWHDRILVTSGGRLYEAVAGPPGTPSRFVLMAHQPAGGAWAMDSNGDSLLIGNATGVFRMLPDGRFLPVVPTRDVVHLVMVGPDLCYMIGATEIGALRWQDGKWSECAPRISGIGFPPVVHAVDQSAWIEFGANKVARLSLHDGRLDLRVFEDPAWKDARWVNVGAVGDIVVMSGSASGRRFFDEKTGQLCDAPGLQRLLARSPYWITRIQEDNTGALWATHRQGVVKFTPTKSGDYKIDSSTFDLINDLYPVVCILPGNDVWFTGGRSLYHVERSHVGLGHPLHPTLVSVIDAQTGRELVDKPQPASWEPRLPLERSSLRLRFFSGSYAWRRAPTYEFRINDAGKWATLGAGSSLSLSGLGEGRYHLEARIAGSRGDGAPPAVFSFEILAPWYRTWPAYLGYGAGGLLALLGLTRWSSARARRRNLVLEQIVRERTGELETTMKKLNDETRVAATLAERNRLAGEIHDSLQQGLSGAILQLDATLRLPAVAGQLRTRLDVVRNMVSFTRHEVQHAVWDMESPLLEDTELGDALRKLTALINPGTVAIEVTVSGAPVALASATKHHLIRIAQEAITNAVRHGNARRIGITLAYRPDSLSLAITDDGIGFDPDEVLSRSVGQFGLRGLRSRARRIQAELLIESSPGRGTSIHATVALAVPANSLHAKNGSH